MARTNNNIQSTFGSRFNKDMEDSDKHRINMTSTQQKEESNASERSVKTEKPMLRSTRLGLRMKPKLNVNNSEFADANYSLEVLCKLLCKPVSVSLTKLSVAELTKSSKTVLNETQIIPQGKQKLKRLHCHTRKRISVRRNNKVKQSPSPSVEDPGKRVPFTETQSKSRIDCKRKEINILKSIKQPYIRLQRIDKVINKIAQSFAKVISDKDVKSSELTQHVKETPTESNALTLQSPPAFTNSVKNECLQINETQNLILESPINENFPRNQCVEHNSDEVSKFNNKERRRKRCMVIYDSDDTDEENSNVKDVSSKVIPSETQELKSNSLKHVICASITAEEHSASNALEGSTVTTSCKSKKLRVKIPSQELDIPEESANLADKQNSRDADEYVNVANTLENMPQKSDHIVERDKEDCASNCVPSEIDFISTSEDICPELKDSISTNLDEPRSLCNEIQDQLHEPFTSEEELTKKYKLFKNLRVFLIKLDSIKTSLYNKYSATEIEQLTDKYINILPNSEFRRSSLRVLSPRSICPETSANQSDRLHHNSSACTVNKDVQNVNETSLNACDKSPSCFSDKAQEQQENSPKSQKESSKERSEDVPYHNSKSKLSLRYALISPRKSATKDLYSSNTIENTINIQNSSRILNKNFMIKSCSELLNSTSTENALKKSLHDKNSEQITANLESCKDKDNNKCRKIAAPMLIAELAHVNKLNLKPTNALSLKVNGTKNSVSNTSSMPSTIKYNTYKCIVCDLCFEDYSLLQQHLSAHRQKQNSVSTDMLSVDTGPLEKISMVEKQKETISSESKTEESSQSKRSQQTKSPNSKTNKASLQKEQQEKEIKINNSLVNQKRASGSKKRIKLSKAMNDTNECSICSHVFPTKSDLAAHIFLHTESELQRAFKNAKQKMTEVNKEKGETDGKEKEQTTTEKSVTKEVQDTVDNISNSVERSLATTSGKEENSSELSTILQQNRSLTAPDFEVTKETETNNVVEAEKSIISNESEIQALFVQNNMENDKISKITNKRRFIVCPCHNRPDNDDNCLKIEIVLLCHNCRVIFRSIECFETHYRLPDFALCNQNRLKSGRSPNLFCAACGMIFSSVQDVRYHLETHARFKQNIVTDFRCTICKVVFIGIGTLFYTHWSKHAKDAFWVASEQSFPRSCLIKSKSENVNAPVKDDVLASNKSTGTYIQVAEHICYNCKMPFVTEDDLKRHKSKCGVIVLVENTVAQQSTVQKCRKLPKICLTCSLCNDIFLETIAFYRHVRCKHNFISDPEFVCVSLITIKKAFICTVCMDISNSLDKLEEHWVKHSTKQLYFGCMHCKKDFDSLSSFMKHVKEHESRMKEDILSCTVIYRKAKFVCTHCNIGFDTQKALDEHNITHKINFRTLQHNNKEILNQGCSTSISEINNVSQCPSKSKELVAETQKEISVEEQVNTCVNTQTEKNTAEYSTKTKDIEKEKLINILEGNEDSENELTIDLAEHSKENGELRREEESKKKFMFAPIWQVSTIVKASAASENCTTDTRVKKARIQSSSQNSVPNVKASGNHEQVLHANLNTSNSVQANLPENIEELTEPKKNSPLKSTQGYLRVKNLAELVDNINVLEVCKFCGRSFENTENLRQHVSTHKALNQGSVRSSQKTKRPVFLQDVNAPSVSPVSQKRPTMERRATQSHAVLASDQSLQQSIHSSTSAYHKNLPACNIIQKSVVVPRSSIQKGERVLAKAVVNSSNIGNIQAESATARSSTEHLEVLSSMNNVITNSNTKAFNKANASPSLLQTVYQVHSNGSQNNNKYKINTNTQPIYKPQNTESTVGKSGNIADNVAVMTASNTMSNSQNYKQSQVKCASSTGFYQYPNISGNNLSNNNQRPMQTSYYYKNPTAGGMSIVINQTTPTLQTMPTTTILPGQGQQQHVYQPFAYTNPIARVDSYVQQSQNINNFSGQNVMYPVTNNQYEVPVGGVITTYEVMMQAAEGLVCPYCPNAVPFMSEELLQLHVESAHNYECDMCNERFHGINELTLHRTKHTFI